MVLRVDDVINGKFYKRQFRRRYGRDSVRMPSYIYIYISATALSLSPITARPILQPRKLPPSRSHTGTHRRRRHRRCRCRSKSPLLNYPSSLIHYYQRSPLSLSRSITSTPRRYHRPETLRMGRNKKRNLERYESQTHIERVACEITYNSVIRENSRRKN